MKVLHIFLWICLAVAVFHFIFSGGRHSGIIFYIGIIGYTGAIVMISYGLMQLERSPLLNNLLRLCFPTAILIALLDLTEHILWMNDMNDFQILGYIKWLLVIFIIVVTMLAALKHLLKPFIYVKH